MRTALLSTLLLLTGCPKGFRSPADMVGTRWEGTIQSGPACEHGGYQGHEMRVCMVFGEGLHASVDWDSETLRPACDYFAFAGSLSDQQVSLLRTDDPEEADDRFDLKLSGEKLQGTFQVHPACTPWPVELTLSKG